MDSFTSNKQQTQSKFLSCGNIAVFARGLMTQHGLSDWSFKLDNAKRRAGCCKYRSKTIQLSRYYVDHNTDADIRDTILHEVAHSIAGHAAGHGPLWKAVCRRIGAKPIRCYNSAIVKMPEAKYGATCPCCSKTFNRHRKPKQGTGRFIYCISCGPDRGKLDFVCKGTQS